MTDVPLRDEDQDEVEGNALDEEQVAAEDEDDVEGHPFRKG